MIKNIIFDIGDVLLDFDFKSILSNLKEDECKILLDVIHSPEWSLIDYGILTEKVAIDVLCDKTNNVCNDKIAELMNTWASYGNISDESILLLDNLRKNGYKVYLLSNISKQMHDRINEFNLLDHVDGYVFSYLEKQIKPYNAIYETIISRYALDKKETLFLDDRQDNINTAINLGINGNVVKPDDFNDVINVLKSYNINIDRK